MASVETKSFTESNSHMLAAHTLIPGGATPTRREMTSIPRVWRQ